MKDEPNGGGSIQCTRSIYARCAYTHGHTQWLVDRFKCPRSIAKITAITTPTEAETTTTHERTNEERSARNVWKKQNLFIACIRTTWPVGFISVRLFSHFSSIPNQFSFIIIDTLNYANRRYAICARSPCGNSLVHRTNSMRIRERTCDGKQSEASSLPRSSIIKSNRIKARQIKLIRRVKWNRRGNKRNAIQRRPDKHPCDGKMNDAKMIAEVAARTQAACIEHKS